MGVVWNLTLVVKHKGKKTECLVECASEREADEVQLSQMAVFEKEGMEIVDAYVCRERK